MIAVPESPAGMKIIHAKVDSLLFCLGTAKVKNATPTRAGGLVQVRISWTEPDGKKGLGYFSRDPGHVNSAQLMSFVEEVFRLEQWAEKMYESHGGFNKSKPSGYGSGYDAWFGCLKDELTQSTFWHGESKVHELKKAAERKMLEVVQEKKHVKKKSAVARKKALVYIDQALNYALKNGVTDDEIREMLKTAFVKHTMES